MFDGCVLGVDPGLASAGLASVGPDSGQLSVLWAETVRTPSGLAEEKRLRKVYGAVREAISDHRPAAVAVERLMWGKNVGSAMAVARASGVILLAAADAGVPIHEYAPLEVKMAATGVGNAGKADVRRSLSRLHGVHGIPTDPDAADAAAIAFCHLQQSRLREAAAR
ncbi:MAG: crossover junction endodeoxyribonuclease RuvC [Actinomycetota bacterium]